jgi:hypothetical protein
MKIKRSKLIKFRYLKKTAHFHPIITRSLCATEGLTLGKTDRTFKKKELVVNHAGEEQNKTQMKDRRPSLRQAKNPYPLNYAKNDINA